MVEADGKELHILWWFLGFAQSGIIAHSTLNTLVRAGGLRGFLCDLREIECIRANLRVLLQKLAHLEIHVNNEPNTAIPLHPYSNDSFDIIKESNDVNVMTAYANWLDNGSTIGLSNALKNTALLRAEELRKEVQSIQGLQAQTNQDKNCSIRQITCSSLMQRLFKKRRFLFAKADNQSYKLAQAESHFLGVISI